MFNRGKKSFSWEKVKFQRYCAEKILEIGGNKRVTLRKLRGLVTKFYAVTVGKRCGVFQRWYFILNFSMHGSLTVESRTYVSALTSGTPGATFQGFNSLEEAEDEYFAVKALGHVKVVRVPGDELIYGPLSDAKM